MSTPPSESNSRLPYDFIIHQYHHSYYMYEDDHENQYCIEDTVFDTVLYKGNPPIDVAAVHFTGGKRGDIL